MEADEAIGDFAWMRANGDVRLAGPARLAATRLDLDIARGAQEPALTGDARWELLSAPRDKRSTLCAPRPLPSRAWPSTTHGSPQRARLRAVP